MPTLTEYAQQLSTAYLVRKNLTIELEYANADLEARKLALVPADGWPGKNEVARETAAEIAYTADAACKKLTALVTEKHDRLTTINAEIDGLQELASAERWRIRELLAHAIAVKTQGEHTEDASPTAPEFEQAAQVVADAIADGWPY